MGSLHIERTRLIGTFNLRKTYDNVDIHKSIFIYDPSNIVSLIMITDIYFTIKYSYLSNFVIQTSNSSSFSEG